MDSETQGSVIHNYTNHVPFDEFIHSMNLVNDELCKAVLEKDYLTINLMGQRMADLIKNAL